MQVFCTSFLYVCYRHKTSHYRSTIMMRLLSCSHRNKLDICRKKVHFDGNWYRIVYDFDDDTVRMISIIIFTLQNRAHS